MMPGPMSRDRFILEPGTAYMNNASLGMPPGVRRGGRGGGIRGRCHESRSTGSTTWAR